ncbi:MAG: 4Fe-4S binding protein, partial [Bacteroidaceae bacterium]|nr:4Fe-4S binding protein [Bacteroidaceae bacterium]
MLRKLRIGLAAIFYAAITLLFLDFTGTTHNFLGWMAKIQFLPALLATNVAIVIALILLTLLLGRVYCSIICPLGVMQDIIAFFGRKSRKNRYSYSPAKNILRYTVLVLFIVAMVAGVGSAVALLAPYSAYGRIAQNLLSPLWIAGNNVLAYFAERADSYAFYTAPVWIRSIATFSVAAATLVIIAILSWRGGRTYCNTICP